ncbi:MAG TPA: hypothetical protein VJC12_02425 [Candidatus Paceibacterota bacterium]
MSSNAKRPLAEFVGVSTDAVNTWLAEKGKPNGIHLLRLRFYLDRVGYSLIELISLRRTSPNYALAEMLALGVLPIGEAVRQLKLSGGNSSVLRIALGKAGTSRDRAEQIIRMKESRKKSITEAVEHLKEVIRKADARKEPEVTETPVQKKTPTGKETSVEILAHLVLAITPLLENAVSGTREERNELRKLTGSDGMFRLSKASSRLCSEKALEVMNGH